MNVRINGKKRALTFGDFIAAAYRAWGKPRAKGFVRLAVNAQLVEFRGLQRFLISPARTACASGKEVMPCPTCFVSCLCSR